MGDKEALIVLVGFLGAGKTTLLKKIVRESLDLNWKPFVILNDYQNANLDAQMIKKEVESIDIASLTGSCICCDGVAELRNRINDIPERENGITIIEANGTSDACVLMEFLGVGINDRFAPPIQISVVNARDWQKRGTHNELEANQVQVSSQILLSHTEELEAPHIDKVTADLEGLNPYAKISSAQEWQLEKVMELSPVESKPETFDHKKSHWSSCSSDLPDPMTKDHLLKVLERIPESVLRVKGATRLDSDQHYTYFERVPSGQVSVRPYYGVPCTGPKLLSVGPGSDPQLWRSIIEESGAPSEPPSLGAN